MHFEQRSPDNSEASILPLINVVFLLLIFFMIAGSLSVSEPLDVSAPESTSQGTPEQESLRLLLAGDGQMALQGRVMDEAALLHQVELALQAEPGLRVQLKADAAVPGNRVVKFMEQLHQAGVEKLFLITLQADQ
ncbi:ExbD/TolR family protein [Sedimenticola thiotaurini]|uniref:Biopolymer transporter ExbD n=1 Tax=Sedimenticola thiotaurini TaxID=1543721 RepID=A0A0F7JY05_9GAMM|nr:biopolymer transporter ExbD [Sedimenticola thiotaurini]AKH20577.1 hypothetical protein AAY24_09660 [Sedimenticola thiotaurini]